MFTLDYIDALFKFTFFKTKIPSVTTQFHLFINLHKLSTFCQTIANKFCIVKREILNVIFFLRRVFTF